jgi:5-methyltetrahydrofolate--homocysteine methyltransferase
VVHVLGCFESGNRGEQFIEQRTRKMYLLPNVKKEYVAAMREIHANRKSDIEYVYWMMHGQINTALTGSKTEIDKPDFTGIKVLKITRWRKLSAYIDWSPFFSTWEMSGTIPPNF